MGARVLIIHPKLTPPVEITHFFSARGDQVHTATDLGKAGIEIAEARPSLMVIDVRVLGRDWVDRLNDLDSSLPADIPRVLLDTGPHPRGAKARKVIHDEKILVQPFRDRQLLQAVRSVTAKDESGTRKARLQMPKVRLPLRTKITLPYLLLAILMIAGAAYIVSRVVFDSVEERFTNQVIETRKLAAEWMVKEESRLLESLRLISATQGLEEDLIAGNMFQLRAIALPIAANAEIASVEILDASGKGVLSLLHDPEGGLEEYHVWNGREDLRNVDFIRKVLSGSVDERGDKYSGIASSSWGDFLYVAGPISDANGALIGAIAVGEPLSELVESIHRSTLAQTTIYGFDGMPLATTFLDHAPQIGQQLAEVIVASQGGESYLRTLTSANVEYTEVIAPIEVRGDLDVGLMGTSLPQAFLVRPGQITRLQIFGFVAFAFLFVVSVGLFLADNITRPISRLVWATSQVARGNLGVRLEPRGSDEVAALAHSFNRMIESLHRSNQELMAAYDTTIEGWSKALEMYDRETEGHTQRVTDMTLALARKMGINGQELVHIRRGALLHDIGKMGVPGEILNKPGRLSHEENAIMRRHTEFAGEMLSRIAYLQPALEIPLYHHERWDGSGYPRGLRGEEIPLSARIFAVIDVWDALTSDRPYRDGWQQGQVLEHIRAASGTKFDPRVVERFMDLVSENGYDGEEGPGR
jgi:putative nucleotidyltransferase with HDIG domain